MDTPYNILLAEDDAFVRNIYYEKLTNEGFVVTIAENGIEAIKQLETKLFDLVILDQMMPHIDGLEVLRKININPDWKKTPVIMLTNASEKEQVDEGLKLGVSEYLIKSHFTPNEVVAKILELLKEKKI